MEELPKIDLPEEWLIGTGVNKELLKLYTNFPYRLKSEIFVLCMDGEIEASVNLNRIRVRANDFVTIMPGSILQHHQYVVQDLPASCARQKSSSWLFSLLQFDLGQRKYY